MNEWKKSNKKFTSIELIYWIVKKIRGREPKYERTVVWFDYHRFSWFSMSTSEFMQISGLMLFIWMKKKKKKMETKHAYSNFYFNALLPFYDRKYFHYCCSSYTHTHTEIVIECYVSVLVVDCHYTKQTHICIEYFWVFTAQIWQQRPGIYLAIEMSQHFKSNEISNNQLSLYVWINQ